MNKLKFFLKRFYRLTLSFKNQEEIVWKELKNLHYNTEWKSGIYEKEKYVETIFEISKERGAAFYYIVNDGYFHCRVKILDNFPVELATDLFILAAHFNNLLNHGVVVVNVNGNYIEYHHKREIIVPLLFTDEIYIQLMRHHSTSKDIYGAFQRLVLEQEAPAIIIADLIRQNESDNDESS
jgi:hypothetical protein